MAPQPPQLQNLTFDRPPKTSREFQKRVFDFLISSNLPYTSVTAPQFKKLASFFFDADEALDNIFPDGDWITRDWLLDAYPEVRSELDPELLARGDQMTREWAREKAYEEP